MIYITKQEGLYQNNDNSSLVSTCNCKMDYCKCNYCSSKDIPPSIKRNASLEGQQEKQYESDAEGMHFLSSLRAKLQ